MTYRLVSDIKNFFKNELSCLNFIVIFFGVLILSVNIYNTYKINKTLKAVHHRYFNTVRTTQDLYDIKINTLDGSISENYHSPYKR